MGQSILTFISHSSEDKESLIEPIVNDLEKCYINVWVDRKRIMPGDSLRKSIFRDGLDKADVVLIFFTEKSLKSSWVDKEIKHVLREESAKGNNFDLNKIISIFDSKETYEKVLYKYPELTDYLMHLMPIDYNKEQLGQLISAIWSKYLSLQGGDVEVQKQLLSREKEIFEKEKQIQKLTMELTNLKLKNSNNAQFEEFQSYLDSGKINDFIKSRDVLLRTPDVLRDVVGNLAEANAFGLVEDTHKLSLVQVSKKGKDFFKWLMLNQK